MVLVTYCISCQYGDHDNHYEVVEAVPEGVIGGAICKCKGECHENHREIAIECAEPLDLSEFTEFMARFDDPAVTER